MERAAPHVTGWPVEILGFGDRDLPDATAWGRANSISAPIRATTHGGGTPRSSSWLLV